MKGKILTAEYIFNFKDDKLEINPGTFYVTKTIWLIILKMCRTFQNKP